MAIIATLESVTSNRTILAFIVRFLLVLPALLTGLGGHSVLLDGLRVPINTKTDLTHRRSVALLARPHPKCPFQAGRLRVRVTVFLPTSTGVLVSDPDYRDAELARSIRHLTYSS
jgi:hypothetical protein